MNERTDGTDRAEDGGTDRAEEGEDGGVDSEGISDAERAQLERDGWIPAQAEIDALYAQAEKQQVVRRDGVRPQYRNNMQGAEVEHVEAVERARRRAGMGPSATTKRSGEQKMVAVRISVEAWAGLKELAEAYNYWHGGSGNISALMENIGAGNIKLVELEGEV